MRIIYLANSRIPTEKAHGTQIVKMCEAFVDSGDELELIISNRNNWIKEDIFSFYDITNKFKIKKIPVVDAIKIFNNSFGFILQSISFAISCIIYLKKIKYRGVIYSRDYFILAMLSLFGKYQLYYEIHTWSENINWFRRYIYSRVYFVTISNGIKKELVDFGINENKILVAPDGVDLNSFRQVNGNKIILRKDLYLPQDRQIIAYIGKLTTMGQEKGMSLIFASFKEVLSQYTKAYLLVVGLDKKEIEYTKKILNELNIGPENYQLIGHVNKNEVIKYEKSADALLMAYPDQKHYRLYMSPLKMFEYMASGVPIISTDLPAIREILNESNSLLVKPGNTESFAGAIIKIFIDDKLAQNISQRAMIDIEQYTWEKRSMNILQFIKQYDI